MAAWWKSAASKYSHMLGCSCVLAVNIPLLLTPASSVTSTGHRVRSQRPLLLQALP